MIVRIWQAWANGENAGLYEAFLKDTIFPLLKTSPNGPERMELYRAAEGDIVAFKTIMWFEDMEAVRRFAGPQYEKAVVEGRDLELLSRFDEKVSHYGVVGTLQRGA